VKIPCNKYFYVVTKAGGKERNQTSNKFKHGLACVEEKNNKFSKHSNFTFRTFSKKRLISFSKT
jgi:hypothetical protein